MNYYEILEISKNCTLEDIKKSYKKLCLKYHPDLTNGDSDKFLKIREAYDFLIKNHVNLSYYDNIWSEIQNSLKSKKNPSHSITLKASILESQKGFNRSVNIFFTIPCEKCSVLSRSSCKQCLGTGYCKESKSDILYFNNINKQDQIFIFNNYHRNIDLRVKVHVEVEEPFKIRGNVTEVTENINIFKAILGGSFNIRTLEGTVEVNLPPGNISDFTYVLKEKGLFKGDLLIKLKVFLSKNLTEEQKKILNILSYEKN
jgi:DnaJ-class molecular chaperone